MSKEIKALYRKAGLKPPDGKGIHTKKFHECVVDVTKKGDVESPHAVCMASLGKEKAVKKSHQRNSKEMKRSTKGSKPFTEQELKQGYRRL